MDMSPTVIVRFQWCVNGVTREEVVKADAELRACCTEWYESLASECGPILFGNSLCRWPAIEPLEPGQPLPMAREAELEVWVMPEPGAETNAARVRRQFSIDDPTDAWSEELQRLLTVLSTASAIADCNYAYRVVIERPEVTETIYSPDSANYNSELARPGIATTND